MISKVYAKQQCRFSETKIKAVEMIKSQLQIFPYERSVEALRALAVHRGATTGFHTAGAFILVRALQEKVNFFSINIRFKVNLKKE
jgi:hypothetical protein